MADASPDLLAVARRQCPSTPARLVDLRAMPAPPHYDVITCRGVLNDLIIDADREAALWAMSRALRPGGFLFCDVREAGASAARATGTSVSKKMTLPEGGELTFTSTSSWSAGLLLVREEHVLVSETPVQRSEYQFAMRPWTREEITDRFTRVGLNQVTSEPGVCRSTPDRLFDTPGEADERQQPSADPSASGTRSQRSGN
jgi:methyltransferase family protein